MTHCLEILYCNIFIALQLPFDRLHGLMALLLRLVQVIVTKSQDTVNVRVWAVSLDKLHPQFGSADFGKKIKIKFEVPIEFYCYKQTRTNNQGFKHRHRSCCHLSHLSSLKKAKFHLSYRLFHLNLRHLKLKMLFWSDVSRLSLWNMP